MGLKENIAAVHFKAMKNGILEPKDAVRFFGKFDFIMSRKLSRAGRFIRKNQLEYIMKALDPNNRRAWTSVLFPAEILYPFGVLPLSLEILSGLFATVGLSSGFLAAAAEAGVPNTMCSFHRLLIGLSSSGFFAPPDLVAVTSLFCDGNLKSFSEVAANAKRPFLYLDIPYEYNEASVRYLKAQLEEAAARVAEISGVDYSEEALRISALKANRAFGLLRKLYELRKERPQNAFRGFELVNFCFPSHYLLGSDILPGIIEKMIASIGSGSDAHGYFRNRRSSGNMKRLMWMHIVPQYDTELWDLVDNGITSRIVCEEYTSPYFEDYDLGDPLGSIARRLIAHPSNGPVERRIEHSLKIAKDFRVDGVIHYSSWGCHQAAGNVSIIEREFERNGIRFLNINGDAVDKDNTTFGQHRTRIEAFLERI